MEMATGFRVVRRHWFTVVLPVLVVFAVAGVLMARSIHPTYRADGTVVFLRKGVPAEGTTGSSGTSVGNPWQTVDYSLNQFALLMAQAADDPAFRERVARSGGPTNFTVATSVGGAQGSPVNQTPTLSLSVTADSPEDAMSLYHLLVDALRGEVGARQQAVGAPPESWITVVDLTVPTSASKLVGSRVSVLITMAALGTLTAVSLAFLAESVRAARARRSSEDDAHADDDDDDEEDERERHDAAMRDEDEVPRSAVWVARGNRKAFG